jgi:NADH dehydrogenase
LFVGLVAAGFFCYDATTYHPRAIRKELNISQLALSPKRGGKKNLPIADNLVDDGDTPEMERSCTKPKLVILGTGWAVS